MAKHTFLTVTTPSGYALNLKALVKLSNDDWISQLSYEILRFSFERKLDKLDFSEKNTSQKPASFMVNDSVSTIASSGTHLPEKTI